MMNTKNINKHSTIILLIFLNLPFVTLEDQENFSQNTVVQTASQYFTPGSFVENSDDLNLSTELSLELTDNSNESSNIPTGILPNDTSTLLPTIKSTIEVKQVAEDSLVSTREEIPAQNIFDQTEIIPNNISSNISRTDGEKLIETLSLETESKEKSITDDISEDIPSFFEWAQKRLEEVEKNELTNDYVKVQVVNGKGANSKRMSWRNYASPKCGAHVVGANAESFLSGSILSSDVDGYEVNSCTSRIWFVVELCEAIQAQRIDLANFEVFSSSPKDFSVSVSESYPTKDWAVVGKFTAKDERDIQSFDIDTQLFGKYIKVQIKSHYRTEYYCSISLFGAYGMSVSEVLKKEDPGNVNPNDEDDDDDDGEETLNDEYSEGKQQKNIIRSITDAVISMVIRVAEALTHKIDETLLENKSNASALANNCSSPRHLVVCNNCSETLYEQVFDILSCKAEEIRKLLGVREFFRALVQSEACRKFGHNFGRASEKNNSSKYVDAFFSEKNLRAMCNEAGILEGHGLINVSQQINDVSENFTRDGIMKLDAKEMDQVELTTNVITSKDVDDVTNTSDSASTTLNEDIFQIAPESFSMDTDLNQTGVPEKEPASKNLTESLESTRASHEVTIDTNVSVKVEVTREDAEVHKEQVDNIMSDMKIGSQSTTVSSSTTLSLPQAPKEPIVLGLSNRIKVLERNMSLSSQYLEELSKKYKKLRDETQERIEHLEDHLNDLTFSMEQLIAERRFFLSTVVNLLFSAITIMGFYIFYGTRSKISRNSQEMTDECTLGRKKRRSSDQALEIMRHFSDEEGKNDKVGECKLTKRSNSVGSLEVNNEDWVNNTRKVIGYVPVLEDNDNWTLGASNNLPNYF